MAPNSREVHSSMVKECIAKSFPDSEFNYELGITVIMIIKSLVIRMCISFN